ncbi:MAG: hypothetical protein AAFU78_09880 [Cyanobacteria bacterium J06633_2]
MANKFVVVIHESLDEIKARLNAQSTTSGKERVLLQKCRCGRLGSRFPHVIYRQFHVNVPACPVQVVASLVRNHPAQCPLVLPLRLELSGF